MTASELANEIVNYVRNSVIEMNKYYPESEKWDEFEDGAGWLYNEVDIPSRLINKIYPNLMYVWDHIKDVNQFKNALEMIPIEHLKIIKKVTVELGGTTNKLTSDLLEYSPEEIKTFFKL